MIPISRSRGRSTSATPSSCRATSIGPAFETSPSSSRMRRPERPQSFTLLIPTYNRPADLARLLVYLARRGAAFPIHVLDSSTPDVREANAALVARLDLDVRVR